VGGATRTSLVLPYYDPVLDPPIPRLVFPVPRDHADYPSIQGELAVIEAQAQDAAHVRVGQAMVILVNNGVAGFFGRMNHVRTTMDFPAESYRRMCPLIVPQLAIGAIFTSDGKDVIRLSDYTLFWAGNFSEEELQSLPSLHPIPDDGSLSVLYPVPTWWTQAARAAPLRVEGDGSLGPPDASMPVMGFMAQQHPEGFAPGDDFEAIGYEPPPPGDRVKDHVRAKRVSGGWGAAPRVASRCVISRFRFVFRGLILWHLDVPSTGSGFGVRGSGRVRGMG